MVNAHNRFKKKVDEDKEKYEKDIKRLNCLVHELQMTVHELNGRLKQIEQKDSSQVNTGSFLFGQK